MTRAKPPAETPEQRAELDRMPFEIDLEKLTAKMVMVRPRYPRAFVLGIEFEAPALGELYVHSVQMEHFEQLTVSPLPAKVFNDGHSIILPIAHAATGIDFKLRSLVDQRVTVRVHFSECRSGEPRR